MKNVYYRTPVNVLCERLKETPRTMIFIAGPRQVGKTTLVRQALTKLAQDKRNYYFVSVDQPDQPPVSEATLLSDTYEESLGARDTGWLIKQWRRARIAAKEHPEGYILVLDEIQKIKNWSEVVKGLWDMDRAESLNLHVVLLGSSPLLMQKGMTESLAGRYELIMVAHWSFPEMYEAFDFDLEDFIYFGGYPGSASIIRDESRWRKYVNESLIVPSIEKDILMMSRVDKPALLKQLFYRGCEYSGQILSYNKMIGHLQDAGNTTTLTHYQHLLEGAGLLTGIPKYIHMSRASTPKWNVLNNALMSAGSNYTKFEAIADRTYWGRMVESAIGAHLYNTAYPNCQIYYWREKVEVDFVIECGDKRTAIEVKSGLISGYKKGLNEFEKQCGKCRKLLVGQDGIPISEFLSYPAEHWL